MTKTNYEIFSAFTKKYGKIMKEIHKAKEESKYVVQEDGDYFYVCDLEENPDGEVWVASFQSGNEADRYCEFLNKEESE